MRLHSDLRRQKLAASVLLTACLLGCGRTSAILNTRDSKSYFEGAAFPGETVVLGTRTPGKDEFRLFQQGATGYVSLQSVRDDVEQRAIQFCDRKGGVLNSLRETTSKPPHILGNFPRAELVFECADKAAASGTSSGEDARYTRLSNLKKLLDGGVLTQAEFDREKSRILDRP